jgi:hypothetical protein
MDVDLFGERISPPKKPRRHLDIFDAGDDLSEGERLIVGGFLIDLAANILSSDRKAAERLALEADRYCACGRKAMVLVCPDDYSRYFVRLFCHARICERCSRMLVKELKRSLMPVISDAMRQNRRGFLLSQVTLTVTSKRFGDLPDRAGVKRLYRESGELLKMYFGKWVCRRSKTGKVVEIRRGKKLVKRGEDSRKFLGAGWVATSEVGHDNNNLHVHVLTYGPIRSWKLLREEWAKITGDSFGVDIRQKSMKDGVNYVLKYIAKPPKTDSYSRLAEYTQSIKGSRRLRTGGIFFNRVKRTKRDRQDGTCVYCSSALKFETMADDWQKCGHIDLYAENRALSRLSKPVPPKVIPAVSTVGLPYDMPF